MPLTRPEQTTISSRVAALEARTGAQVVTAVVGKSDSYPEAPWKAFALGTGMAALGCMAWQFSANGWDGDPTRIAHVLAMLGSGAILALLAIAIAPVARLFIDRARRDAEVTQFARALYLQRGLDRTRGRVGILVLVSLFERKVVILADAGFDGRVKAHDWGALTRRIALLLPRAGAAVALRAGLDGMEALLLERGFRGGDGGNELPDAVAQVRTGP
ncbi:MAG TPA: hypothetical protein VF523_09095 [Burkholderiales bacterium]